MMKKRIVMMITASMLAAAPTACAYAEEPETGISIEQMPQMNEQAPSQGQMPQMNEQAPSQGQMPQINEQAPSQGQTPQMNEQAPSQGQMPQMNEQAPSQGQMPLMDEQAPSQGQAPQMDTQTPQEMQNSNDQCMPQTPGNTAERPDGKDHFGKGSFDDLLDEGVISQETYDAISDYMKERSSGKMGQITAEAEQDSTAGQDEKVNDGNSQNIKEAPGFRNRKGFPGTEGKSAFEKRDKKSDLLNDLLTNGVITQEEYDSIIASGKSNSETADSTDKNTNGTASGTADTNTEGTESSAAVSDVGA